MKILNEQKLATRMYPPENLFAPEVCSTKSSFDKTWELGDLLAAVTTNSCQYFSDKLYSCLKLGNFLNNQETLQLMTITPTCTRFSGSITTLHGNAV
jgi:hypothetical protein